MRLFACAIRVSVYGILGDHLAHPLPRDPAAAGAASDC